MAAYDAYVFVTGPVLTKVVQEEIYAVWVERHGENWAVET